MSNTNTFYSNWVLGAGKCIDSTDGSTVPVSPSSVQRVIGCNCKRQQHSQLLSNNTPIPSVAIVCDCVTSSTLGTKLFDQILTLSPLYNVLNPLLNVIVTNVNTTYTLNPTIANCDGTSIGYPTRAQEIPDITQLTTPGKQAIATELLNVSKIGLVAGVGEILALYALKVDQSVLTQISMGLAVIGTATTDMVPIVEQVITSITTDGVVYTCGNESDMYFDRASFTNYFMYRLLVSASNNLLVQANIDTTLRDLRYSSGGSSSALSTGAIIGIVIAVLFVLALTIGLIVYYNKRQL